MIRRLRDRNGLTVEVASYDGGTRQEFIVRDPGGVLLAPTGAATFGSPPIRTVEEVAACGVDLASLAERDD